MTTGSLTESQAPPRKSVTGEYQWCSGFFCGGGFGRNGLIVASSAPDAVVAACLASAMACSAIALAWERAGLT